mmetsp:Transcript_33265/g.93265  ORF Transcript_33265/g.93265 Transcript_33265/m.93265 type:complete len:234 (+) Transcript_33265:2328-3029(+)
MFCSWPRARSHTSRASGSDTSCAARSRAGSSVGMKGAASLGLSTSLDMLLMITAHWRRTLVVRWLMPKSSSGETMASAAVSTVCTKVVEARSKMVSGFSSVLTMLEMSLGSSFSMSALATVSAHFFMHVSAASLTWRLESFSSPDTLGTMSGMHCAICLGASTASSPMRSSDSAMVCQRLDESMPASSAGATCFVACVHSAPTTTRHAAAAASLTAFCLSLVALSSAGTSSTP